MTGKRGHSTFPVPFWVGRVEEDRRPTIAAVHDELGHPADVIANSPRRRSRCSWHDPILPPRPPNATEKVECPLFPRRARRDRGSAYVFLLMVALLVTIIAFAAATSARVQNRAQAAGRDWEDAGLEAFSAIEHAITTINSTPTWRTVYVSGSATPSVQFGRGSFEWKLVDEIDGDLANRTSDPARLYGIGHAGIAIRIYSVLLEPSGADSVTPAPTSWRWEVNP